MRKLIIAGLLLLAVAPFAVAQDDGLNDLTLVEAVQFETLLADAGYDATFAYPELSPDGSRIAWEGVDDATETATICVYEFSSAEINCTPLPPDLSTLESGITWSRDGSTLVAYQEVFRLVEEPDLWLFDVAAASWTNLTDDGLPPDALLDLDTANNALIDILPRFDPATGDLYFVRYRDIEGSLPVTIERLTAEDGRVRPGSEPETVADITELVDGELAVAPVSFEGLDGPMSVAPDGNTLAFVVRQGDALEIMTIYLLDLASGEITPLITQDEIATVGQPQWAIEAGDPIAGITVNSLTWTADSSEIIIMSESYTLNTLILTLNLLRVSVPDGDVTPYIDYSSVSNERTLYLPSEDETVPFYGRVPAYPPNIAQSDLFVYATVRTINLDIPFIALDEVPEADPTPLLSGERFDLTIAPRVLGPSVGDDGMTVRVYHQGVLLTFERTPTSD